MIKRVFLTPFQKFVKIESFSGILLMFATLLALVWANSPYGDSYRELWQYDLGIITETFEFKKPLILWINDGLMAIFFLLIGLEIKRELLIGELNSPKKIAFPLVGALGGMLVPVIFFLVLNQNPETTKGWGIPMATDIAFSLAILNVLGKRVPLSLKIFLTAFAIVDDIGAVLVIAIFYSGNINITLLLIALAMLSILYFLSYKGIYSKFIMFFFGIIIWFLFLKSGIHPTIAGILLAFSVPIRQKIDTSKFLVELENVYNNIKTASVLKKPILSHEQIGHVDNLNDWSAKFQSPLQHLEHSLHGWVAYFIIPIFALANAGVLISGSDNLDTALVINIIICLVLGKGIGITSIVLLAQKLKWIEVPSDISFKQIIGVAFLAGIGFTMAIFIASLAFVSTPEFIDSAKIGILIGSFISAIIGYVILRIGSNKEQKI
ncbi:Na+/H+ antiporter NhaA [Algibacter lectus]|uniref:Na(+)/H(+) antiporter NhaA n=2 Tax=Algibacter lectus TaxID=221126 RepID=A0A4R8MD65_9FLAO|nr:Na+/H+ antiporter NhaA [Algibacter lectus]MDO7137307.1 Na+/H+ antiporter NhaA [Algibacter lectus]MWW24199.1 Na+/H+ antiporter NhaA [Algibacter lectus]TDY62217.1 sodium/proton antiporter (NhaA family) [Algibacter lectus]SFC73078.1 sodium/proton antiporter, NhaA family [Algibacter lectus]